MRWSIVLAGISCASLARADPIAGIVGGSVIELPPGHEILAPPQSPPQDVERDAYTERRHR